jgi:1-acyl-sn-glycerol-3-phosphate acyltransferase
MKLILKKAHAWFYVLAVGLLYYFLWPFLYYFSRKPSRYPQLNQVRCLLGWLSSAVCGIFYHFEYEEPIDWRKNYIICPHHTSNLDITAMCILVKNNYHCFMGKEELLEGLVTGLFFRSVDIPVNRDSNISAFRAFKRAGGKLKEGYSTIIFPEGKISNNYPPVLHEFKNGPFRLAIEQKVPIIPVSSLNTWKIFWDDGKKYGSRPGIVHFYVHKPIYTNNLTLGDADNLRDRVYAIISQKTSGIPV